MRLFIAGRSRLPARFEPRLDIDPCPVTHMTHQPSPGPWRCSHTSLPAVFDLILGTCVPIVHCRRRLQGMSFLTARGLFGETSILVDREMESQTGHFLQLIGDDMKGRRFGLDIFTSSWKQPNRQRQTGMEKNESHGAMFLPASGRHEEGSPPRRKDRTTPADRGVVHGGLPLLCIETTT